MPVIKSIPFVKDHPVQNIVTVNGVEKEAKSFTEKLLGDVNKSSATKLIILGSSSGLVTGLLTVKVGRTAAIALGGGIILVQIANKKGYIKINWNKVNKQLDEVSNEVKEKISGEGPTFICKVMQHVRNNIPFSTGFVGGFLIGCALG